MEEVSNKKVIINGLMLVLGVFLLAVCYNLFLLPNNFAFAGTSGIALLVKKLTGFSATLFIYLANIVLIFVSILFLGWEKTKYTIIGAMLYPLMISLSSPITNVIIQYMNFDELMLISILTAVLYGFSNGLIYKSGFTTGGNDVIMQILHKYLKIPESAGLTIVNGFVIFCCLFVFGLKIAIYSFLIMIISSYFIDKVIYGIQDSKLFYIYSRKPRLIKKVIFKEFHSGFTVIPTKGGYSHAKGSLFMVAVSNKDYYKFKSRILEIDPEAFFIIDSCYEVNGGVRRPNIPFIDD